MDQRHIVALEIGSSKIKGLVAAVGSTGDIQVIAVEETRVNNCVRYGKIQNIQEVSAHINDIIRKIENNPAISPRKVTDIFVSLGGRSLSTVIAQSTAKYPNAVEITADTIDRLKREASFGLVTDKANLDMVPHAFYVDNSEVKNVVGTVGSHIRAEFSTIVISTAFRRNLDLIKFDGRSIDLHFVVRPTALADLVLTASERQLGCALIDFGAETTTITIYKSDVLQSIVTLPIGSRNITRDLMLGLSMTEESAESAKSRIGSAIQTESPNQSDNEINNYISARAGEIVANILHQIELTGLKPQSLPAGIILTGGGSRLRNFDRLIENQTKMAVRIAAIDSSLQFKGSGFDRNANIDLLALAKYAVSHSSVDCLTAAPEPVIAPEPVVTVKPAHPVVPPRTIDEDDLLGDDDDLDDDLDDDQKPGKHGPSIFKTFKDRLSNLNLGKVWNDPVEDAEDDDLDAPLR